MSGEHTKKVVLFDIDGTLVDCGGAGRRAMEDAFEGVVGKRDALDGVAFGGMTDPAIVDEGLSRTTPPRHHDELAPRLLEAYLAALPGALAASAGFRVLAGGDALATHLAERGHAVGLGTGNVRRGAVLKLEKALLWRRFSFGGFACDSSDRPSLLRIGAGRGAALLDPSGLAREVWIVGDTPRDVAAAKAIGARCLAVTTGRYGRDELTTCGADHVVDTLADPHVRRWLD